MVSLRQFGKFQKNVGVFRRGGEVLLSHLYVPERYYQSKRLLER